MPCSVWEPGVLVNELRLHIELAVRAPVLRRLLLAVLEHPEVRDRLPVSPAAAGNHHAYRAGLVEHTLSMMRLASLIGQHYTQYYPGVIEPDLLVAGVLLHDLGKVWELEGDLVTTYSTPGNLVGHIPMGAAFIERVAREQGGIPIELVWELQHLILSHHGQYEYGSPKLPATIEAQILHFIDTMDARTNTFVGELGQEGWSFSNRIPGKVVLNPAALRRTWAEPSMGKVSDRGPGAPWGEAPTRVSVPNQPPAVMPAPVPESAPASVSVPNQPPAVVLAPESMAAPERASAVATAPLPDETAALPSGELEAVEVSPISRPLTLSLFDGLS
jgi:3'-5' exoribonuclease